MIEVLLGHPGGPFWAGRDEGVWSIPKGEFSPPEDPLAAARREFQEETGLVAEGRLIPLEPVRYSGKILYAWALDADLDPKGFRSNTFKMEWPPGSGRLAEFPEIDKLCWFPMEVAKKKILKGQLGLLAQLQRIVSEQGWR